MEELCVDLARSLREVVLPLLGSHAGRSHEGPGGGDITFGIDAQAEDHLEAWLAERAPQLAYFSEDRGMVGPSDAEHVLIVDPIDGTRPAMAGFEAACVSVAAARMGGRGSGPTMADVEVGVIVEIKSGQRFVARRGGGAELLDASSTGGAAFDLGSATYDLTRIVTGQLDAYVEPSPRIVEDVAGMRAAYERVGRGAVLNTPYDLAAAVLCVAEAGAVVTGARGEPLDDRPLLDAGPEHQMSCIAAANPPLHRKVLDEVEHGIRRLAETTG